MLWAILVATTRAMGPREHLTFLMCEAGQRG